MLDTKIKIYSFLDQVMRTVCVSCRVLCCFVSLLFMDPLSQRIAIRQGSSVCCPLPVFPLLFLPCPSSPFLSNICSSCFVECDRLFWLGICRILKGSLGTSVNIVTKYVFWCWTFLFGNEENGLVEEVLRMPELVFYDSCIVLVISPICFLF